MKPKTLKPSLLHQLLVPHSINAVSFVGDRAAIDTKTGLEWIDLVSASVTSGTNLLGRSETILKTPMRMYSLSGYSDADVQQIRTQIDKAVQRQNLLSHAQSGREQIFRALVSWRTLEQSDRYLTRHDFEEWRKSVGLRSYPKGEDADLLDQLDPSYRQRVLQIEQILSAPKRAIDTRNAKFADAQKTEFEEFFDTIESSRLTDEQRDAIVHDAENALVIAGAGTGKTSAIVGKVAYLIRRGLAKPDEILLLAYASKAAAEMRDRIEDRIGIEVSVRTFHSLGMEIIGQAVGKKPRVCAEATDVVRKAHTIKALIEQHLTDEKFRKHFLAFSASSRLAYRPFWEFKSKAAYTQYRLEAELRTLNGILVKSDEEVTIGNWLVTQGITFEYERPYDADLADAEHRQYTPDFYLTDYKITIEHWGVDRNNRTAAWVDNDEYIEKMEWARTVHKEHRTVLVETYSWQRYDGTLLNQLEAKLTELGVVFQPLGFDAALKILNDYGKAKPFETLVGTVLSHFKSSGLEERDLRERLPRVHGSSRTVHFLEIFMPIYQDYEAQLHERGEIDFEDMIAQARRHVEQNTYRSPFKYILIDEFQDIARGRAELVRALRNQVQGSKIFAVGDDWQSIYRFAGSDISLTTGFERFFGDTRRTRLSRTFRFNNMIADLSSWFVQQNPEQMPKHLVTGTHVDEPAVVIWYVQNGEDPMGEVLDDIARRGLGEVYLLSRYKSMLPRDIQGLNQRIPDMTVKAMTMHASKGGEADYVILNGLKSGKDGFPSEIEDDDVMRLVLPDEEAFPFAEERRLFYVALTRAKRRVYLLADASSPSCFIREVLAGKPDDVIEMGSTAAAASLCPHCERGQIVPRVSGFGRFYGCSNYPVCDYLPTKCARCESGWMRLVNETKSVCNQCAFEARACPACNTGVLIPRQSKTTKRRFLGCSNYRSTRCGYMEAVS